MVALVTLNKTDERLRIALVWPLGFDPKIVIPLALGYLKSNLPAEKYDVRIFDNALRGISATSPRFKKELTDFAPHVVGVSSWSPTIEESVLIIQTAKELLPDVVTVGGGAHVSSYAHKVLPHLEFDFVFRGEADLYFTKFLEQVVQETPDWDSVKGLAYRGSNEEIVYNDKHEEVDLDTIKFPDYEAMNLEKYQEYGYRWNTLEKKNAPLWVTRGCPYRCTFCAAPELNGRPVRTHSIEYMVDWVKYLYEKRGVRWFNIVDDNFTYHLDFAKEFCRAMIGLSLPGVGFSTPNGIRMNRGDKELWALMKQAGWGTVIVAPESGSQNTLAIMEKDLKLEIVPRVVNELREAGLKVQAFFILGYPGEGMEDINQTSELIKKCRFNFVFMNNFQPLPGTPVYDQLVEQGEIEDGLMPINYSDGIRVYTPKGLESFNFPRFVLKTYILMMLRDPLNIPYMVKLFNPLWLARKVLVNILGMLNPAVRKNFLKKPKSDLMPTAHA
jgi:anaerobic magnesium-protoporphyrin IX monomethyl ester cyclase